MKTACLLNKVRKKISMDSMDSMDSSNNVQYSIDNRRKLESVRKKQNKENASTDESAIEVSP